MLHRGFHRVSPIFRSFAARVLVRSADVAQPVEHLFCKQAVSGSSPLVSSVRRDLSDSLEGCPSGQREQAVNLPAHAYVGSNPTPSTNGRLAFSSASLVSVHCLRGLRPRPAGVNPVGAPPPVSGA